MRLSQSEQTSLIEGHLPIAQALARRFRGLGVEEDDLTQEIMISLCESARSFDQEKHPGVPFFAYARRGAVGRCADALLSAGGLKASVRLMRAKARIQRAITDLRARGVTSPTPEEVSKETGLEIFDVELCLSLPTVGKMEPADLDLVPDAPLRRHQEEKAINELWAALDILDPQDRAIVTGRHPQGDGDIEISLLALSRSHGIPVSTLKRRLDGIYRRLRTELLRRGFHRAARTEQTRVSAQAHAKAS